MPDNELAQWFVVQTMSGQEFKARQSIERRRELEGLEDVVLDIAIPTEKVTERKQGKKITTERKLYPGYIFVKATLLNADGAPHEEAWYFIRDTPGVIGFVGGDKPVPISSQEADDMLRQQESEEEGATKPKVPFEVGEVVTINDGPFENFEGPISSVDFDRSKLVVMLIIFDRSTPVEVEYWQVERNS
ncbi:MAG: transcription termination/antitermination factor NusG [Lentisphaeria bacterium]|nr:transcription termination/antitermination factor NusG [Lentisphaeria bacterium]